MAVPTGVYKRGAVFHIQIKVPTDLQASWPTPFYVRKSLGTEDRAAATAKAHRLWADATEAFAIAREKLKPREFTPLTPALAAYVLEDVPRAILAADDVFRFEPGGLLGLLRSIEQPPVRFLTAPDDRPWSGPEPEYLKPSDDGSITPVQLEQLKALQSMRVNALGSAMSLGRLDAARRAAEATCASLGVSVDWSAPANRPTLIALLRAMLTAWIGVADRSAGRPVETPGRIEIPEDLLAPAKPPKEFKKAALKLRDVVPYWLGAKTRKQDAQDKTERALKLFEASGQDQPLSTLTRAHGAAVRAFLMHPDRTFKGKTALNNWQSLQALMNVALDVGLTDRNPWNGMTLDVTDSETREVHTTEELQQLFHSPLFLHGVYPVVQKVSPDDAYWCMLLGLWSGARVGEIAQLEVADAQRQNGLDVLSIHGKAGTIKTEQSKRVIPVSPELVRLGFVEWVNARRAAGAVKLFPSFHRKGAVTPGEIMSEWNREYRKSVGALAGPLNGYHRFRHTVRSALAAMHVGIDTADALTGHSATGSSGRKVYTHIGVATVHEALGRLKYPLALPRVFPGIPRASSAF